MKKDENVNLNEDLEIVSESISDLEVISEEVTPEGSKKELTLDEVKEAVTALRNVPYVKILNSKGDIVNPITKKDPYKTVFMNGKQRRDLVKKSTKNPKNNKKGARVVITKLGGGAFTKSHVRMQTIKANVIPQLDENLDFVAFKETPSKTILHNDFKH